MTPFLSRLLNAALFAALISPLIAMTQPASSPPQQTQAASRQFIYMLRLAPRLHDDSAWTQADQQAVSRHFAYLQQALAQRRLILAGRSDEPNAATFGLVIFEAADEAAARAFMNGDPAVAAGVMTATLHPYKVALSRAD